MYKLFNTEFKTKAAIQAYCRALLEKTEVDQHFTGEHLGVLIELVGHRGGGKKLIKDIKSIFVRRNAFGTAKGFYILYVDGTINDFSYIKAVRDISLIGKEYDPQVDAVSNFKSAMRFEIRHQMRDFKNRQWRQSQICAISGEELKWEETHVDHHPTTFDDLLWDFCKMTDLRISEVKLIDLGEVYEIEDRTFRDKWLAFHAEHARFRLATAKANVSAPKSPFKDWHSLLGNDLLDRRAS